MNSYDLIVIGTGAGGLTAGFTALGFGKKVLFIDKAKPGGECTWSGCIPSKALINIAKQAQAAHSIGAQITIDTANVLEQVQDVIANVYAEETPEKLQEAGADFVQGEARFIDRQTVKVNEKSYSAKRFVIATGSSPLIIPIPGLDSVDYLTNDNFFTQQQLPDSVIVLGGGAIGLELAQAMNRLGTQVTVVEMMAEVMFREEQKLAAQLREQLAQEGVDFLLGAKATQVNSSAEGIQVNVEKEGSTNTIQAKALLLALGRKANTAGLGLEDIGCKLNNGSIEVNAKMQTSIPGIYACGDVVGPYQFSHMANYQGKIATMNALLPFKRKADYSHAAWTTFTEPEFARTGLTEQQAREQYGDGIRVYEYDFEKLDRAKTKLGEQGRIKLICDKRARVLGAHILGPRAGELICEVQVIKSLGKPFSALQSVIHPYPTYADSLRQLAQQVYLDRLLNNPVVRAVNKVKSLFSRQTPSQ